MEKEIQEKILELENKRIELSREITKCKVEIDKLLSDDYEKTAKEFVGKIVDLSNMRSDIWFYIESFRNSKFYGVQITIEKDLKDNIMSISVDNSSFFTRSSDKLRDLKIAEDPGLVMNSLYSALTNINLGEKFNNEKKTN